jgi:DNA-binding SARP family transcriptional activator/ABC-type transporter Mla MlaB component
MDFSILGTLAVAQDDVPVEVRGPRQRALLALFLLYANQVLTSDRIVDLLWAGEPPRTAANTLQTHVVRLRQALRLNDDENGESRPLRTIAAGYVLDVDPDALDAARFETLLGEARRAIALERPAVAHELLRHALALWRGPALVEFASEPFASVDATRLDELRIDGQQEFAAAALACGRVAEAISTLQPLVGANPLREQPVGHLMVALYRANRQGDALRAYGALRIALRDELGLDPSPELQRLERLILEQAPNLELVSIDAARRPHALPAAALVASPPFIGRTRELAWLVTQWHAACQGEPRLAILQGEPGIGKTRIAAEFGERCYRGGTTVLWGRCTEDASTPFEALAGALSPLVGTVAATTPLWQLFGVRDEPAIRSDPDVERQRMFQLIAELLERAASDAPVLLVLDDLQWVDRSTLALLAHFMRAAPPVCVLVLATVRTSEASSADSFVKTVDELIREGQAAQLIIEGLDAGEVDSLVTSLVPLPSPERFGAELQERTGGNPFFVTALLHQIDDIGEADFERLDQLDLPVTVRGVIDRRVAPLDSVAREVLDVAAIIGVEFDCDLVSDVIGLSAAELATALEEINGAGIAHLRDERDYVFAHALYRDALYRGLGSARRSQLHFEVGMALERSRDDRHRDRPAQLAHHFAASDSIESMDKATRYATRAGEQALAALAYEDACSYFDTALELVDRSGDDIDSAERADIQFGRARALFAAGDRAGATAAFEQVATIYRQLGDPDRLAGLALAISGTLMRHLWTEYGTVSEWLIELVRDALAARDHGEHPGRVRLLARLAEEMYFSTDADARTAIAEEALDMARRLGDDGALADALSGRLRALWHPSNVEDRLQMADELRVLAAVTGDDDLVMAGAAWHLVSRLELGLSEGYDDELGRYATMTEGCQSPQHRIWALALLGGRALMRGDFDETERVITEGMNVAPEFFGYAVQGFAGQLCTLRIEQGRAAEVLGSGREFVAQYPHVPAWRAGLSVILAELGLHDEAREQLAVLSADGLAALRRDQEWLFLLGAMAETCSLIEAPAVAADCYELLAPYAERCIVLGDGYVLWCSAEKSLGILAHTAGRPLDACRHLERALSVHRSLGALPLVARTEFELARAFAAAGAEPAAVTGHLESARREATGLSQYGLLRWIELFAATQRGPARR